MAHDGAHQARNSTGGDDSDAIARRAAAAEFSHDHPDIRPGDAGWATQDLAGYVARAREKLQPGPDGEPVGVAKRFMDADWSPSEHEAAVHEALPR